VQRRHVGLERRGQVGGRHQRAREVPPDVEVQLDRRPLVKLSDVVIVVVVGVVGDNWVRFQFWNKNSSVGLGLAQKPYPHGLRLLVYVVEAQACMLGSGPGPDPALISRTA
jgi:hypothetical protein